MGRHDGGREDAKSDASSSSSDGSENESEADFETEEAAIAGVVGKWDAWPTLETPKEVLFARHKLSRCIHSLQDETGTCFKCGRGMSHTHLLKANQTLCNLYATLASDRMACDVQTMWE